jgi:transcriptional regulator GlxA family with amidase domain
VTRHIPPSAGSIICVPAGSPIRARPSGRNDELHIFVEPGVVEHAAAEAFEFDPRPARRTDSALPRTKLHAVVAYIEDHLDTALPLAHLAATVHLSAYHFARQFKAATGLPPHQYVVTRRVERAQHLLRHSDLSLVDIAASAGFSDQSKLSAHFKRVVGLTPRQFRQSARIA